MISELQAKFAQGRFEYSGHALQQGISRNITLDEVIEAIANGEVLEDYPNDKYGPSCLILGFALTGRPCIYNALIPADHSSR